MAKRYPADLRVRATRMALERLEEYGSPWAAAHALAPKLGVGAETLRKWIIAAQADAGERPGPTTAERDEIKQLKAQVRDLQEANDILRAATVFFARELDPRHR